VSGATLGVARAGGGLLRSGSGRGGLDLPPSLLLRKKDSSRAALSCAAAPGKVLVPGGESDELVSSDGANPAQPEEELQIPEDIKEEKAESNTTWGAEEKLESSEQTQGIMETITQGFKEVVVEEKPRVIPKTGDGQKIYQIDPMLKDFRTHLDYRYSEYRNSCCY